MSSQNKSNIARLWHGAVPSEKTDAYYDYLLETGIPDYQNIPGNCRVYVFRRIDGNTTHFLLLTLWSSIDAIKEFSGNDIEQARYYPADEEFLLELEPNVIHYEVLINTL